MKISRAFAAVFAAAVLSGPFLHAADNAVLFWNEQAVNATRLSRNPPPVAALHLATFHAAIYDTVNGIAHTHESWLVKDAAPAGADLHAAIASAALATLKAIWGEQSNARNFDVAYESAIADIADSPAKTDGIAWGRKVAEAILANRAKSGFDRHPEGTFVSNEPGKWRETPPAFRPAVAPQIATVTPFIIESPSQFRCPPPYTIGSKEYAEELAYVAKVGPRDGAERTEYQTLSTPFWADNLGTATPAGHWNTVTQDLARRYKIPEVECARLFALLNFATADAGISAWDTKFFYRTWRPETALREVDAKINRYAEKKPDFIPNMASPAFPSYASAHSAFTGAATRLLADYFGSDDITFTVTSDGLPGVVRTYHKLSDACRELGMSRVWGGIHTMADVKEGMAQGQKVGDWVFSHALPKT